MTSLERSFSTRARHAAETRSHSSGITGPVSRDEPPPTDRDRAASGHARPVHPNRLGNLPAPLSCAIRSQDNVSIIRLLRVFVGAAGKREDELSGPLEADPSTGEGPKTSPPSPGKCPRVSPDNGARTESIGDGGGVAARALAVTAGARPGSIPGGAGAVQRSDSTGSREGRSEPSMELTECGPDAVHAQQRGHGRRQTIGHEDHLGGDDASSARAQAAVRIEAGCTLWDVSMGEPDAEAMLSNGLIAVAIAVLQHCADAESSQQETGQGGTVASSAGDGARAEAGGGSPERELSPTEAIRLREITCGLLANVCTHPRLR